MADAKQGKSPEDFYNGTGQSRVVLAKPRLGGFGSSSFASSSNKTANPFSSVLRPSQLKPTVNPFLKVSEPTDAKDTINEQTNEDRLKDTKEEAEVPKFVPLGSNTGSRTGNQVPAPAQSTSSTSSASFVFGQNLSARVVMENVNGEANNGEATVDHSSSNGTNELLFSNAAASVKENNQEEASTAEVSSGSGLAAAAAEYERSHARPAPPAATFSLTGEEGEINVLQILCRLFAWESGSWRERGRGMLRLNDAAGGDGGAARLVARVSGSLRVVLNTKLWPDMVAERAGTKSLRITAADAQQQVKLFLIMGAPLDITQLHRALTTRIAVSKRTALVHNTCTLNATSQQAAERLEAAADESDYLDKDNTIDTVKVDVTDEDVTSKNERLETEPMQKTEEYKSNVDGMKEDHETKALKRKEPVEDETSPKRPCPEITNE